MHRGKSKNFALLVQNYLPTIIANFEKFMSKLSNKIRRVVCIIGALCIKAPNSFASFGVSDCQIPTVLLTYEKMDQGHFN